MKRIILQVLALILVINLLNSCKNERSLQQFIITQQEKQDIISFDLSSSLLSSLKNLENTEEIETLKSLKKINILAYLIKDSLNNRYTEEKQTINTILKQEKYSELMRFGNGSKGAKLYLVGEEESIDELIVFANDNELGWLLLRVLGDDMQPAKIMKILQNINLKQSDFDLSKFKDILN